MLPRIDDIETRSLERTGIAGGDHETTCGGGRGDVAIRRPNGYAAAFALDIKSA